jgi:hypothetical protein
MQGQGPELRYDFPVVSDDAQFARGDLSAAEPGDQLVSRETLYQAGSGRFDKGPVVGTLTLIQVVSVDPEVIIVRASFRFDDGDRVAFEGEAPGNGSWNGEGLFGYVTGTGKFKFPRDNLPVDSQNPKRWG